MYLRHYRNQYWIAVFINCIPIFSNPPTYSTDLLQVPDNIDPHNKLVCHLQQLQLLPPSHRHPSPQLVDSIYLLSCTWTDRPLFSIWKWFQSLILLTSFIEKSHSWNKTKTSKKGSALMKADNECLLTEMWNIEKGYHKIVVKWMHKNLNWSNCTIHI